LVMKDFEDYFVFEGGGANFTQAAILEDISPNYIGSTAPRSITGDFDNDVRPETVFGDFDGDILVYEHGGGNTYTNRLVDTTNLIKSATYITKGDFDGDGIPEFFVAAHASSLRNADFEYDVAHWRLRIFKATGDNQYEVIWEDYLYDIDTDPFNAATAGNLDDDPADELLFTTFPRTYLIDFDGNEMQMAWFRFGDLATHHIIMDLNGNGINEIGIGRGDTTFFWEKDVAYTGPQVVTSVQGRVLGPDRAEITWQASPNATDYGMVHIKDPFSGNTTGPLFPTAATSIIDSSLENGSEYLFFVVARNQMLTPNESPPGTFVVLRPHENNRVDSVVAVSPKQLTVYFSQPVIDRDTDKPLFLLNGTHTPSSIIQAGNPGRKLILGFDQLIPEGMNTLRIDPDFLDAERGILNPADSLQNFRYEPAEDDYLFLTKWEIAGDKEAILFMNYPLDEASALDTANYEISPVGSIRSVAFASEDMDAVRITVNKARFGALGYPISITVTPEVCAINQVCFQENEGNTATFSAFKQDLSEVFVYPNPVRNHDQFDGLRFANLTQIANIRVMSVSGRMVTKLEETDGDGGLEWDMRDRDGRRIKPGIYIYHVTADGVDDFIGKFSVVE
ncbi:MAG: T9SS type A sorting domain-containing protein, partial [Bacteroidota bacterium]